MNFRLIAQYLSYFAGALALAILPSILWALYFGEWNALSAFAWSVATCLAVAGGLYAAGRGAYLQMQYRDALAFVGASWLMVAGLGALPFVFEGVLDPVSAYFESMSGFTTTGSTVLVDIESTAKSLLFWRATTQWLGGMGIVVLFIAVLPYLGAGGKQLFRSESPGPNPRGLQPRIQDTATFLYKLYLAMTLVLTVLLMIAGMDLYEALCHTFATLATGGFSTRQASIAAYDSVFMELTIMCFMIAAGTNFALYFAMARGDWRALTRDTEWRMYIAILVVASLLITLNIMGFGDNPIDPSGMPVEEGAGYYGFWEGLRYASFQTVSILTTSGYATADYDAWPYFSRMLLVVLMCVGGCAGSTSGGIKVVRFVILLKSIWYRLELTFRPKLVRAVRVAGERIEEDVQRTIFTHFALFGLWLAAGSLLMSWIGLPFEEAVTSVIAMLNNIGPGLGLLGPVHDYSAVPDVGKLFLSLCMALGRLELFTITVFLLPAFWKKT